VNQTLGFGRSEPVVLSLFVRFLSRHSSRFSHLVPANIPCAKTLLGRSKLINATESKRVLLIGPAILLTSMTTRNMQILICGNIIPLQSLAKSRSSAISVPATISSRHFIVSGECEQGAHKRPHTCVNKGGAAVRTKAPSS